MAWTLRMGAQGAALASYEDFADFRFTDRLFDFGAATIALVGLNGNGAPQRGWVVKIVWDYGLATESVEWEGVIDQAQKRQDGNLYAIRAYTLDAMLHTNQTGTYRNYLALTPHAIIQAAGTPNPLLVNSQGTTVLPYGAAAGVPNKVDGVNPGVALTQFVSDTTTLFDNMRRLCMQARYVGGAYGSMQGVYASGDYGLEWRVTMEGANASTPTFYLVKRRERAAAYTPEVFNVTDDLHTSKRGNPEFPGIDSARFIGGGDGTSRIDSGLVGAGSREAVVVDKAILNATNATNAANRVLGIYGKTIEMVSGESIRHGRATRAGDVVQVTQTGHAATYLRCIERFYQLSRRAYIYQFGRPMPMGRDTIQAISGATRTDQTTPQFTDVKPESLQSGVQFLIAQRTGGAFAVAARPLGGPSVIGAILDTANALSAGTTLFAGSSFASLGECESLLCQLVLDVDVLTRFTSGERAYTYDKTTSVTIGATDAAGGGAVAEPHTHTATPNHTATAATPGAETIAPLLAGPFQIEATLYFNSGLGVVIYQRVLPHLRAGENFFDFGVYPFAVEDPGAPVGDFSPTRLVVTLRNDGDTAITVGVGAPVTWFGIWRNALHRHNEL